MMTGMKSIDVSTKRVDQMMQAGLIEEVRRLKDMGYTKDMVSMQGLGYKEILDYLDGNTTLEEAVYILKRDTRHFAKRQLTWFRREHEVIWVEKEKFSHDNGKILDFMKKRTNGKRNIMSIQNEAETIITQQYLKMGIQKRSL